MKRAIIAIGLLVAPSLSQGQAICRSFEYAELRDMPTADLQQTYCRYDNAMRSMFKAAESNIKAGYMAAGQRDLADSNRCAQELDRITRLLNSRKEPKPTCPAE